MTTNMTELQRLESELYKYEQDCNDINEANKLAAAKGGASRAFLAEAIKKEVWGPFPEAQLDFSHKIKNFWDPVAEKWVDYILEELEENQRRWKISPRPGMRYVDLDRIYRIQWVWGVWEKYIPKFTNFLGVPSQNGRTEIDYPYDKLTSEQVERVWEVLVRHCPLRGIDSDSDSLLGTPYAVKIIMEACADAVKTTVKAVEEGEQPKRKVKQR